MKRWLSGLLSLCLLISMTSVAAEPTEGEPVYTLGDVTQDGTVGADDALLTLRAVTQQITLTAEQQALAEVSGDGQVAIDDALLVLQYIAGQIERFPAQPEPEPEPEEPYQTVEMPMDTQRIEAESGSYPDTCGLVKHGSVTAVGFTSTGDQYHYTVSVAQSGYYQVAYAMSVIVDLSVSISVDGHLWTTSSPAVTKEWSSYYTNYLEEYLYLDAGEHQIQFEQDRNGLNFDWFSLTYVAQGLPEQMPADRAMEVAFTSTVVQAGRPLPLAVSGLAEGDTIRSYIWCLNGNWIATENLYAPDALTIMDTAHVRVWVVADIDGKTYFQTTSGDFDTPVADPLPIVRIDTENQAAVDSKETYVNGAMAITADGVDSAQLYNGAIQIRGRGNSTWGYPKKPYKIKLNKKADLFGMGANKHWVLIANYRDRTLMRNRLAADLSDHLGLVTMHSVFVRVYLNGQDVGVYDLCEQIRVGKTRVDIYDWEDVAEDETDLSGFTAANGYDTTGGFIIELNGYYDEISKFKTAHDVPLTVKSPEYLNTNDEMFTYLTEYIQDFEDAVYNKDTFTSSKGQHYSELFDVDDLVDYWLVNEFMGNLDSGSFSSTYMYKDIGGDKFHMGPVWDFDSSSGNYHGHSKQCPADQWVAGIQGKWYRRLYRDRSFVERLRERYWENRDFLSSMATRAEQYYTALYAEAATDHDYWKIPTTYLYDGRLLVDWLNDRVAFFDAQFETVDTAYASLNS